MGRASHLAEDTMGADAKDRRLVQGSGSNSALLDAMSCLRFGFGFSSAGD